MLVIAFRKSFSKVQNNSTGNETKSKLKAANKEKHLIA